MTRACLLDTDTLSELIKGKNAAVLQAGIEYLAVHGRLTFSIITRYEILRGLRARGARRQEERFHDRCRASEVLDLTDEIVDRAASIYAELHRAGELISDADILIAATALVHRMPLVTGNEDHFRRVAELEVGTWRSG